MPSAEVLRVEAAFKSFSGRAALSGATLTLRAGEWLGLLGPNGAGKSTLIRAIAGRAQLDSGRIELLGNPVGTAQAAGLGVVPQEIALYPLLSVTENLFAFGSFAGLSGAVLRERVEWAVEWTGLRERRSEPIQRFSGGMKRRLNIACGVLARPRVVLLDEPTVGVDPQSRERIWQMCDSLRSDGASLLLTTHQLDEAQQICERITIIDQGRTIASGTFAELVQQTVGPARLLRVRLDGQPGAAFAELVDPQTPSTLRTRVRDVAEELPALLERVRASGRRVEDIHVEPPTLQNVFLHLTGRELRE